VPVRAAPGATPAPIVVVEAAPRKDLDGALGARLTDRWELDPGQTRGTFLPRPYKPVYVLPLVHANAVNRQPTSGNPATSAATVAPLQPKSGSYPVAGSAFGGLNGSIVGAILSLT
jgi:phospholipase A1